jgi:inorganic triphosphatase YgiF
LREVELKLRVHPGDVKRLRARLDRFASGRAMRIDNIYFDTAQRHLAAGKAALRLRCLAQGRGKRWVQTFKTEPIAGALSERGEWETQAPGGRLDLDRLAHSPLADLLGNAHGAGAARANPPLLPVFQTVFDRTAWDIALRRSRIEAALDIGRIVAGDREETICELELELRDGSPASLVDLALALAAPARAGGSRLYLLPYGESKAVRGYRLASGDAPPAARSMRTSKFRLAQDESVASGARRWLRVNLELLLAHVARLDSPDATEHVHQARVCLRRMRAGLDMLGPRARIPVSLRGLLRRWSDRVGVARGWDVLCAQTLPALAASVPGTDAVAWKAVAARAQAHQRRARDTLRRQVAKADFADFSLRMLKCCLETPDDRGATLEKFAPEAVKVQRRRLWKAAGELAQMTLARQHKFRIQVKNLRYGIEMLRGIVGRKMHRLDLKALARVQDRLGHSRDAALAVQTVRRLTRSTRILQPLHTWAEREHGEQLAAAVREVARIRSD